VSLDNQLWAYVMTYEAHFSGVLYPVYHLPTLFGDHPRETRPDEALGRTWYESQYVQSRRCNLMKRQDMKQELENGMADALDLNDNFSSVD
jgi:hypothetical protein